MERCEGRYEAGPSWPAGVCQLRPGHASIHEWGQWSVPQGATLGDAIRDATQQVIRNYAPALRKLAK